MKLKIRVKCREGICLPTNIDKGDWIDLHAARSVVLKKGEMCIIPLGVAIQLPKGFEAHILPRSSTPKKFNILCANSQGVIDQSYCGDKDIWGFPALAIGDASKSREELAKAVDISSRGYFQDNYLTPALRYGYIARTLPDKPKSKNQRYYLTDKGLALLAELTKG